MNLELWRNSVWGAIYNGFGGLKTVSSACDDAKVVFVTNGFRAKRVEPLQATGHPLVGPRSNHTQVAKTGRPGIVVSLKGPLVSP